MNEAREPLHQPPNPDDLRRVPPASPDCARVRGWMRDFADDDLEPGRVRELEEHVHRCRLCAVELARAEHEVMRLRSAFAMLPTGPTLAPDFASRLVERLVVDETSMVSREALAKASAAAVTADAPSAPGRRAAAVHPVAYVLGAVVLLWVLSLGVEWFDGSAVVPRNSARLVLESGSDVFASDRRLGVGDNLGEHQSLRVGRGGRASLSWHDPQAKSQPAALLHVHGDGQVRLEQGAPRIQGNVDVETYRPVSIPMADGSHLDLGIGEYSVSSQPLDPDDPLAAMPRELRIEVAVKSGQPAMIVRDGFGPTLVAPGLVGGYQTSSRTEVSAIGGGPFGGAASADRVPVGDEPSAATPLLIGHVRDGFGDPGADAWLLMSFGAGGASVGAGTMSGGDGQFALRLDAALSTRFVIAQALAPSWRAALGYLAPDAIRVLPSGSNEVLRTPLVFETSVPFLGLLRDADGGGCAGVDVVPCVVDELFGSVLPLTMLRTLSDAHGVFRCTRLPARLPPHQSLVLLLLAAAQAPMAVPIPERGSVLAGVPFPPIELQPLRPMVLHQLTANQAIEVFEEVPGLPPGSAVVRRAALPDGAGVVQGFAAGPGKLWMRAVGASGGALRLLTIDQSGTVNRLRPETNHVAWSEKFGALQVIPGTAAQVLHAARHDQFATTLALHPGITVQLIDGVGRPAVAQVFALGTAGPRGRAAARFLGFSGEDGRMRLPPAPGTVHMVAIGADGSAAVAAIDVAQVIGPIVLQPTGRVLLHESLRPAVGSVGIVPLVFERADTPAPGLQSAAVRFASAGTGWEVGNLVPGLYDVRIGGTVRQVQVPANGWGILHE